MGISKLILIGFLTLLARPSFAGNCECEVLSCDPCQKQTNLEFYTAKCDGHRLKSCSRPVCEALDPLPGECSSKNLAAMPVKSHSRIPAQAKEVKVTEKVIVGTVMMSFGNVDVLRDTLSSSLKINQKIFNGDEVLTGETGKAKIVFTDSSQLSLLPKSKTRIQHEPSNPAKQSSTVINLFYGTVRSTVTKSENGQKKYRVETPSAVAGVRGTDFLTSYYEGSQITKVQTLEGAVELASLSGSTKSMVPAGHYASFVVDTDHDVSSASMKYVDNGFITPLGSINADQAKEIDHKFDFDSDREVASNAPDTKPICDEPVASFNQCSYTCLNNPKKAETCRTDLPQVKCQRQRCNANGVWAEETRLPASHHEKCPAKGINIDKCDY